MSGRSRAAVSSSPRPAAPRRPPGRPIRRSFSSSASQLHVRQLQQPAASLRAVEVFELERRQTAAAARCSSSQVQRSTREVQPPFATRFMRLALIFTLHAVSVATSSHADTAKSPRLILFSLGDDFGNTRPPRHDELCSCCPPTRTVPWRFYRSFDALVAGAGFNNVGYPHGPDLYANPEMHTPNLDELAMSGVRLERHCEPPRLSHLPSAQREHADRIVRPGCCARIKPFADVFKYCSPTRSSLLTGRLPVQ
eukprot:SAG31_NODE_8953_length_1357_cov_2.414944_1_plen_253_part_00